VGGEPFSSELKTDLFGERRVDLTMATPALLVSVLRRPERIRAQVAQARTLGLTDLADAMDLLLASKASNDLLEACAIESIGAVCSGKKLGADGFLGSAGVEAKPKKTGLKVPDGGCINDDTPMKLLRDATEIPWVIFQNAEPTGDRINWQVTAPYSFWLKPRFLAICDRLGVVREFPESRDDQLRAMEELVSQHRAKTYVRSNPLDLRLLLTIPPEQLQVWLHPEIPLESFPSLIRDVYSRTSALPTASSPPVGLAP
jgi:hypothetical protein